LIDEIIESVQEVDAIQEELPLPRCSVRQSCRWFAQRGATACQACPVITTDRRALVTR
jgi:hypothetical protein